MTPTLAKATKKSMYVYDRKLSGLLDEWPITLPAGRHSYYLSGFGEAPKALPAKFSIDTLKFQNGSFSTKLQTAFEGAITSALNNPAFRGLPDARTIPIAMIALDGGLPHPVAGQRMFEMFYSGSLLKVAAMYAAFRLREAVNDLAATLDASVVNTPAKLFQKIIDTFNNEIDGSVPRIRSTVGPGIRLPKYPTIFEAALVGGRWKLKFNETGPNNFATHLIKMVVESDNDSAGFCIRALGYSWINGVLQSAGFLNLNTRGSEGIWLAGDYGKQSVVLIPSVNDKDVKQATTCIHMAWLFALLHDKKLAKDTADPATGRSGNDEMLGLLERAVDNPHASSLLKRVPRSFVVKQSKIGVGQLKKAPQGGAGTCNQPDRGCVLSEASILRHPPTGREFVAVWQNVLWDAPYMGVQRVATIIQKTMDDYRP